MAHGIMENDWMLSFKVKPWHGLGEVVTEAPTSDDALRIARLDWDVQQFPVFANGNEVEGFFANVRMDTNEALGVVKSRYTIHQNKESFAFVDEIIQNAQGVKCRYETAGSLFNGRRVFLVVRLPNIKLVGDKTENYLFFSNSHDGSSAVVAGVSSIRVVCNNTLQFAQQEANRLWKCRHTKSLIERRQQAMESLGMAVAYTESIQEVAEKMAMKKVDEEKFFKQLYEKLDGKVYGTKGTEEVIEKIAFLHQEKDDLQNFKGTSWGLYNAVADYYSNSKPLRETHRTEETRLVNFMDGNKVLDIAESILLVA